MMLPRRYGDQTSARLPTIPLLLLLVLPLLLLPLILLFLLRLLLLSSPLSVRPVHLFIRPFDQWSPAYK